MPRLTTAATTLAGAKRFAPLEQHCRRCSHARLRPSPSPFGSWRCYPATRRSNDGRWPRRGIPSARSASSNLEGGFGDTHERRHHHPGPQRKGLAREHLDDTGRPSRHPVPLRLVHHGGRQRQHGRDVRAATAFAAPTRGRGSFASRSAAGGERSSGPGPPARPTSSPIWMSISPPGSNRCGRYSTLLSTAAAK